MTDLEKAAANARWNAKNPHPNHAPQPPVVFKELPDTALAGLNPNRNPNNNFIAYARGLGVTTEHMVRCGVGVAKSGAVVFFHFIPNSRRPVFAKCVQYLKNGKRDKNHPTGIRAPYTNQDGYTQPCYFAGVFVPKLPTYVVESEKTAVICSFFFPKFNWIAIAGASGLTNAKAQQLKGLFANKTLAILLDNDTAGANGAAKAVQTLKYVGIEAKIVVLTDLFPNAPSGADAVDLIEALISPVTALKPESGINTSLEPQNALETLKIDQKPVVEPVLAEIADQPVKPDKINLKMLVDSVFPFCQAYKVDDTVRVGLDLIDVMHHLQFSGPALDNIARLITARHHETAGVMVQNRRVMV